MACKSTSDSAVYMIRWARGKDGQMLGYAFDEPCNCTPRSGRRSTCLLKLPQELHPETLLEGKGGKEDTFCFEYIQ